MSKPTTEQKNRWNKKTYRQYTVSLRYDQDADVMELLEAARTDVGVTEYIRQAVRKFAEKGE